MGWKDPRLYPYLLVGYDRNFIPVRLNRFSYRVSAIMAAKLLHSEYPHLQMRIIDERGCYED